MVKKINRLRRVQWARAVKLWSQDVWADIILSDECRLGLQKDAGQLRVWRMATEKSNLEFFKPGFMKAPLAMVWGCISKNGVGKLVVFDGNIDAVKYCDIIQETYLHRWNHSSVTKVTQIFFSMTMGDHTQQDTP